MAVPLNVLDLIECIRERPSLYLAEKSILSLRSFLDGMYFAYHASDMSGEEDEELWVGFERWVDSELRLNKGQPWEKSILFLSEDEFDALERFFVLWGQYCKELSPKSLSDSTKDM